MSYWLRTSGSGISPDLKDAKGQHHGEFLEPLSVLDTSTRGQQQPVQMAVLLLMLLFTLFPSLQLKVLPNGPAHSCGGHTRPRTPPRPGPVSLGRMEDNQRL